MPEKIFNIVDPGKIEYKNYRFTTYATIEGVKHPMLWSDLEDGDLIFDSLFEESKYKNALRYVGPYLVELDFECIDKAKQSDKIISDCYGANSTLFFATPLKFDEALSRVREIFYLESESGEREGIFRFYEPINFHELMSEETKEVQDTLFRHIYCYWCEDVADSSSIVIYRYGSENRKDKKRVIL